MYVITRYPHAFLSPPPPFPFPSLFLSLLPFLPPFVCFPLLLCLPTPTNPELEVSLQEALIKPISLSLRQAALCLCKRTGSFPLGVRWALRRGGAADFSRFSDWKTTDSKEVYPSWVIASWHPWTSSGFRLSPLRGSEEGRQRLKPSLPWGGRKQMCSLGQPPSPSHSPSPQLRACVTLASWPEQPGILFLLFLLPDASVGPSLVLVPHQFLQGSCHATFCLAKEAAPAANVRFGRQSFVNFIHPLCPCIMNITF